MWHSVVVLLVAVGCAGPGLRPLGPGEAAIRLSPDFEAMQLFARAGRASPPIPAVYLLVGPEGVCFATRVPIVRLWQSVRVSRVDPRLVRRVIQPRDGVTLVQRGPDSWEVRQRPGDDDGLKAWLVQHLRTVEDARRSFIELPAIEYAVRTDAAWYPSSEHALLDATRPLGWQEREPERLVGWRWSDLDRADRQRGALSKADPTVTLRDLDPGWYAVHDRAYLPPGPCPFTDGTWLVPRS